MALYAVNHEDGAREYAGDALFDAVDGEVRYVLEGEIMLRDEALSFLCAEGFSREEAAEYIERLNADYVARDGAWRGAEWLSLSVPLIAVHDERVHHDMARIVGNKAQDTSAARLENLTYDAWVDRTLAG